MAFAVVMKSFVLLHCFFTQATTIFVQGHKLYFWYIASVQNTMEMINLVLNNARQETMGDTVYFRSINKIGLISDGFMTGHGACRIAHGETGFIVNMFVITNKFIMRIQPDSIWALYR